MKHSAARARIPDPGSIAPTPETLQPSPAPGPAASAPTDSSPAGRSSPPSQSIDYPRGPVSDGQIGDAIQQSVDFLLAHFKDGEIEHDPGMVESQRRGVDALCVYALAVSSKAISDQHISPKSPEMDLMIEKLKAFAFDSTGGDQGPLTYSRSLRACMLATFNRPQDRLALENDVAWLINAAHAGAYTYDDRFSKPFVPRKSPRKPPAPTDPSAKPCASALDHSPADPIFADGNFYAPTRSAASKPAAANTPPPIFTNKLPRSRTQSLGQEEHELPWDNSNTQYGLLGVWAGAEVGCEVPDNYWRLAQRHWENCQLPSGEWNYRGGDQPGYYSMTLAGIASLLVTQDYLEAPLLNARLASARQPYSIPLSAGLAWLENGDNCIRFSKGPIFYEGYSLFAMERVGLASGFKQFAAHDWFVELAARQLPEQWPDGAFGAQREDRDNLYDKLIDTSYMLLFLSRGRHPIMINKLRYDGPWTDRPRDIANLASYTSRAMERPLNWQVVDIAREPTDWADAPILYISGNKPLQFSDEEIAKLKTFVDNGGMIFTHADLANGNFTRSVAELSKKLFPSYGPLADLPIEHPIYKVSFPIALPRPKLQGVSNGVRLLLVNSPTDLSNAWQIRAYLTRQQAFQLGVNLYLYATGKEKFRNRLDTPVVPEPDNEPLRTIHLARLKYPGNWDPEPGAWPRMARLLQWDTGAKLDVKEIPIERLRFDSFHVAHLTGTEALHPTDAEIAAMRQFVQAGGTLLIDAAGGSGPFADAEASWLPKVLGEARLQPLNDNDPLLKHTIDGTVDAPSKTLRLYAMEQLGNDTSRIKSANIGKGRLIFSSLDLCSGLLGTNTWGILGYAPEYSQAVVNNAVITAVP